MSALRTAVLTAVAAAGAVTVAAAVSVGVALARQPSCCPHPEAEALATVTPIRLEPRP